MMEAETVSKILDFLLHIDVVVSQEDLIAFSYHENFRLSSLCKCYIFLSCGLSVECISWNCSMCASV
jgi:hypothetical protein